jgi:hypothetical protein
MVTEIFWWKSELEWEERDNRIALWIWEFENFVMSLIANKTSCSDLKQTSKPSSDRKPSVEVKIFGRSLTSSIRTAIHSPEELEVKVPR